MEGDNFRRISLILAIGLIFVLSASTVLAKTPTMEVEVIEYISEVIAYDQTLGEDDVDITTGDARGEAGENRTGTSRTGHTLYDFTIFGEVNISNVETVGNSTLVSINITINNTYNMTSIGLKTPPPGNYLVYNLSNSGGESNVSIFIAELRGNHSAIFNFTIQGQGLGEPLNFTENYTSWRMMSGNASDVILNATNTFPTNVLLYDLVVTKTPACYAAVNVSNCFRFTDLAGEDSTNATIETTDGRTILTWNVSNRTLSQNENRQIRFKAWAPENLTYIDQNGQTVYYNDSSDWGMWMNMGNLSASFKFNGTMSGIRLTEVEAVAPYARVGVSKDRTNETHWNATFNITNDAPAAIDYNLTYITVWATKYQTYDNPGDTSEWVSDTNVTAFGFGSVLGPYANATWWPNINLSQNEFNDSYSISFNYSLIPIVWATSNFVVLDDGTQIFKLNQSQTMEDGYLFIEEIYVLLGGYLIKVTKVLTPFSLAPTINNSYIINITIENVGKEKTPEWVSMFDLVPKDFHPLVFGTDAYSINRSMTENNIVRVTDFDGVWTGLQTNPNTVLGYADTGAIASGPYYDYWGYHVDFNGLNATSNGDGRYDTTLSTKEIGIQYKIGGNKSISRIENAYIVGVDPIRLEGANPSRSVASRLAASSTTMEYVVLIGSLIVSIAILGVGFGFIKKK